MMKLLGLEPSAIPAIGIWICSAALLLGFIALIVLIERAIDKKYHIGEEENGY